MNIQRYNYPTPIALGVGARSLLAPDLKSHGLRKPMLVTDRGVAQLPFFAELQTMLESADLSPVSFSEIWGNPVKSQVMAGVELARDQQIDSIIGVGGGAAMDVAKAIALMVHHPGDLFDYEDGKPGALPVDQHIPYLVMIPTTSGTGSEVGRAAVVSDDETKTKKIIFDPKLMPNLALLDPELTLNLPPHITATTGLDALCHLIEAFVAKGEHPMCDGIALEGIRLVSESLVECVGFAAKTSGSEETYQAAISHIQEDTHERHIRMREKMLQAAMMGAVAFQKGLGVTHSCAHALSSVTDMHHGLANGILLPFAMRFNQTEVPERFERMAHAAGLPEVSGDAFIAWLVVLQETLNIPTHLSGAGVETKHLDALTEFALQDGCHQLNPRACDADALRGIFTAALG